MPYFTEVVGERVRFTVDPDPLPTAPKNAPHLKLAMAIGVLIALIPVFGGSLFLVMLLLIYWLYKGTTGGVLLGQWREVANVEWRRRYQFEAGPHGVTVDGKTLNAGDIHRIRILKGSGEEVTIPSVTPNYDLGSVSGRAQAAGYRKGMEFLNTLTPLTHRVQIEAKGAITLVAGGVTPSTAFAVKEEIERVLTGR